MSTDIAAKLEQIKVEATAKTDFNKILTAQFGALSDRNVSLLLFLRAIDCYLTRGVVGSAIATDMAEMVRSEWAKQQGFRSTGGQLTSIEKAFLQKSPMFADENIKLLAKYGISQ